MDSWMGGERRYFVTPDASPRHVYHNVIFSIDSARELNNGHPGTLAAWIDAVAPGRVGQGPQPQPRRPREGRGLLAAWRTLVSAC